VSTILNQHKFNLFYAVIALVAFVIVAIRSYAVPLSHDEAATFFFFIQSGNYMPFYSQVDANNHVLNSFLGNICFHVFGDSPFALRLPNLLGFVIMIVATYSISKHLRQLGSKVFLTAALLFSFHWLTFFSACRGYGLSMALLIFWVSRVY
jgi:4-amino-4-deoxy-L-arabinose transferase-like glycosyltransferase